MKAEAKESRGNKNCNVFTLSRFPMPWMSWLILYCIVNQPKESRARARIEFSGTVLDSITSTTINKQIVKMYKFVETFVICI